MEEYELEKKRERRFLLGVPVFLCVILICVCIFVVCHSITIIVIIPVTALIALIVVLLWDMWKRVFKAYENQKEFNRQIRKEELSAEYKNII
jgi:Flp pilus assembly protein TadB